MDGRKALALFALLAAVAAGWLYRDPIGDFVTGVLNGRPPGKPQAAAPPPEPPPAAEKPGPAPEPAAPPAQIVPAHASARPAAAENPARSFSEFLKSVNTRTSRFAALKNALAAWGADVEPKAYLDELDDDQAFFTLYAKAAGFLVHRTESDLGIIRSLNMPAILELRTSFKTPPVYLTLTAIEGAQLRLKGVAENETIAIGAEDIWQNWTGVAYLPWKDFLALAGTIPTNAPPESVLALKMILQESGFKNIPMNKEYDPASLKAVEQLQAKYGVPVDGRVGALTKIILYREQKAFDMPKLIDN
jgi:general secretion pathway protein A